MITTQRPASDLMAEAKTDTIATRSFLRDIRAQSKRSACVIRRVEKANAKFEKILKRMGIEM